MRTALVILLSLALPAASAGAGDGASAPAGRGRDLAEQAADPPVAIGQPDRMILSWGPVGGYDFDREETTARLYGDMTLKGPFGNFGVGDVTLEGALGTSGGTFETALGVHVKLPWLRGGYEYDVRADRLLPVFSAEIALARGGLLRRGDELRLEWRPTEREVMVGFDFTRPFRRYRMTRPVSNFVKLPEGRLPGPAVGALPDTLEACLAGIREAVLWMDRLLTPAFAPGDAFGDRAAVYRERIRTPGRDLAAEDAAYHRLLRRAFAEAAGGREAAGDSLAHAAEIVIHEEILVPFDGLFGRNKSPHDVGGLARRACARFDAVLAAHPHFALLDDGAAARQRALAAEVFRRTVAAVDEVASRARERWRLKHVPWLKQSRLVWLPLNYGLPPGERSSLADWRRILAELTGSPFADGNAVAYLVNEQFQRALMRTIRETRDYHVIIIHDFRGRDADGHGGDDAVGWDVVVDGYLAALSAAVADLDSGARAHLPAFHLFVDENYYEINDARPMMTFLEDPLERDPPRLKNRTLDARARAAAEELRRTVARSRALDGMPREVLRRLLRVNVHVTNPYDPVFASDATMRDHRKLAFRDVDEADPAAGEGIVTGLGVGEKYNGTSWEDRGLRIRGPALVALKNTARELFLSQGYDADEVPPCLRPHPVGGEGRSGRESPGAVPVLLCRNQTGYGTKSATVAKAAIYNLLPAGGVLLVPDSLWLSEFWSGMLIGAALRGVDVLVTAPAPPNAPSNGAATLYLMRENLETMIRAAAFFADDLARSGGSLHVGCYAEPRPVQDLAGRLAELAAGFAAHPFLDDALPLPEAALAVADSLSRAWSPLPVPEPLLPPGTVPAAARPPALHLKAQLVIGPETRRALADPAWAATLRDYFGTRRAQLLGGNARAIESGIVPPAIGGEDRAVLVIGSSNQDRRSMLLDGEELAVVAGPAGLMTLPDLAFLAATTTWTGTPEELDAVFPEPPGPGILKWFYRLIRDLI